MEEIMPRRDGTGNVGLGRGAGLGRGVGLGQGGVGLGRGQGVAGRPLGSEVCTCSNPKCGYEEAHNRGIPCVDRKCPKCGAKMVGEFCK